MSPSQSILISLIVLSSLLFLGLLFSPPTTTNKNNYHDSPLSLTRELEKVSPIGSTKKSSSADTNEETSEIPQKNQQERETPTPTTESRKTPEESKVVSFLAALKQIHNEQQSKTQRIYEYFGEESINQGLDELFGKKAIIAS